MKDEYENEDDAVGSESLPPNRMVVPGLEALAGPLIVKFGPIAGREIYRLISEDQALAIRVEESWKDGDDFHAVLRLINLTAHGVYVEKISCRSQQVDVFCSRSGHMFGKTMDWTGKAGEAVEWIPLSDFAPTGVEIFSDSGLMLALKIRGAEYKPENRNPLWQSINSLKFDVVLSRLDLAKQQERVVEVMLRRSGRK